MTPERIAELRKLATKADQDFWPNAHITEFIAAVRTGLPEALDEIERLREALGRARRWTHQDGAVSIVTMIDRVLAGGPVDLPKANPCGHCDGTGMPLEFRTSGSGSQVCTACDGKGNA
jgi:hypothetical protein